MNLGDFLPSSIIDFDFPTRSQAAVPTSLLGTPAISVYKSNSTTESATGVSLTVDFDSRTGFNHVRIDTSADTTFYSLATDFDIVITAGTVSGVSVVGEVIGHFSILNRSAIAPVGRRNTVASATSTTVTLDAGASATDGAFNEFIMWIAAGTGAGQFRTVVGYVGATKVATVNRAWSTTPDNTSQYIMLPQAATDIQFVAGTKVNGTGTALDPWGP